MALYVTLMREVLTGRDRHFWLEAAEQEEAVKQVGELIGALPRMEDVRLARILEVSKIEFAPRITTLERDILYDIVSSRGEALDQILSTLRRLYSGTQVFISQNGGLTPEYFPAEGPHVDLIETLEVLVASLRSGIPGERPDYQRANLLEEQAPDKADVQVNKPK